MKIQFLGQNCFLFTINGKTILSDPFYNFAAEKSGFKISDSKIDYVLITHAHGDHTADVAEVLEHHPKATVIGQPEICGHFNHTNAIDLNIGGTARVAGAAISMVPAGHTSSFPDGSYGGVPCGYIINDDGKIIYLAGDTGIVAEMQLFPKMFGDIDVAILPIGGHYTMCARLASFAAAELLKTGKVIGCHFDTFEPIIINHDEARKCFSEKAVELVLPEVGEILEV